MISYSLMLLLVGALAAPTTAAPTASCRAEADSQKNDQDIYFLEELYMKPSHRPLPWESPVVTVHSVLGIPSVASVARAPYLAPKVSAVAIPYSESLKRMVPRPVVVEVQNLNPPPVVTSAQLPVWPVVPKEDSLLSISQMQSPYMGPYAARVMYRIYVQ